MGDEDLDIAAEEEYEAEEEHEDEAEEEAVWPYAYRPAPAPLPNARPFPFGPRPYSWPITRRGDDTLRGVKSAAIRTNAGTAIVQLPTRVATARGVQRLGQRHARAESLLGDHERRLRELTRAERNAMYFSGGAVALEQVRSVVGDIRTKFAITQATAAGNPAASQGALTAAAVDYTLSTLEVALAAAAVPPSRRTWAFWSAPLTVGLLGSVAREAVRLPVVGYNRNKGKPGKEALTLAGSAVAALASTALLYPRRPRRYVMWR